MAAIIIDLENLYQRQFGGKPVVPEEQAAPPATIVNLPGNNPEAFTKVGSSLYDRYRDQDVWLPVRFTGLNVDVFGASSLLLPHSVIKISGKKNIVKTALAERQGAVKELFSIDDYDIQVKGFLIGYDKSGKYPMWPDAEIRILKKLWELNEAVELDNALTNEFLSPESRNRVVIEGLDLPFVEGGRKHVRPFSFNIVSDTIFELELV